MERVPPSLAASDEILDPNDVVGRSMDCQLIEPHAHIQNSVFSLLDKPARVPRFSGRPAALTTPAPQPRTCSCDRGMMVSRYVPFDLFLCLARITAFSLRQLKIVPDSAACPRAIRCAPRRARRSRVT